MKRLIAAGILLLAVLVINCCGTRQVLRTCNAAAALAEQAQEEETGGQDCTDSLSRLQILWRDRSIPLSLFVNHEWVNEVQIEIDSLLYGGDTPGHEVFTEHLNTIKILISQIEENTKFSLKSIC